MPDGQSLEFSGVTKRFGAVTAVSDLAARVEPGRVTGFLGPNGAGKTTTLRILLGLVRATSGHATIGGRRYAELDKPLQTVGAVLEASSFHPGRTGAAHLTIYAQAAGIPKRRVDEVLGLVGLGDAGGRKVGGYSLGMRQRLGLAYALLGDPGVLVLDEPANGLDPEGIIWMRGFLRQLAAEGRTVLVSSHLLAEVQQTVDALLIISRGRLVFEGAIDDLADPSEFATVVDAPDRGALTAALSSAGLPYEVLRSGLTVRGADPVAVGAAAAAAGVALSALQRRGPALEEIFLDLVNGTRVHSSSPGGALSPVGERTDAAPPAAPSAEAVAPEAAPVAAGVALAAAAGTVPGRDGAEEAREANESALASAELEAEATGAPGAAAALATAAGATWADERADEAGQEAQTHAEAEAVSAVGAGAAEPAIETESQPDPAVEPEPAPTEPEPAPTIPESAPTEPAVTTAAGFAVASTGVIDIVPPADPQSEPEPEPESGLSPEPAEDVPEDADPDVEELGEIDDELSTPEPPDEDDDRPWENYVKTDADVEADAFFAAFDSGDDENRNAPEPADAGPPAAPDVHEAWIPPEAEAFEDAQEAASTPSPDDGDAGDDDGHGHGSDDHEGGER